MINIPNNTLDEWLRELKPYQSNSIRELNKDNEIEEVARIWITIQGNDTTVPFGVVENTTPFWERFKEEFNKFICDDDSYKEEKQKLLKENTVTNGLLISVISAALGSTIGFTATILAPAVVIMLSIVAKVGKMAYCKNNCS